MLTVTLNHHGVTDYINETIRQERLAFRAHCEKLHGDHWRAQWGIGIVVQPDIVSPVKLEWKAWL